MGTPRLLPSAALVLALFPAAQAQADFTPAQMLSVDNVEQAESAGQPTISQDGRFVAFQGSVGGVTGVFRKDVTTGTISLVAGGRAAEPSVSADGRYVSFTTNAALDPVNDTNTLNDVYVRDMDKPIPATSSGACVPDVPCPYELASARNNTAEGITYRGGDGSIAANRVALSANGRKVAFVITSPSDLTGGTPGSTPAGQVVMRDLASQTTTLVSVAYDVAHNIWRDGAPVPDGAVANETAQYAQPQDDNFADAGWGAALSADGTTVAWLGTDLAEQTRVLPGENVTAGQNSDEEPLWRRVADGAGAPIRRVTGGGDPFNPGCAAGSTESSPGCMGPLDARSNLGGTILSHGVQAEGIPQLSADGRSVAFLADAPPVGGAFATAVVHPTDLYVVNMSTGLSRDAAQRPLTQQASPSVTDFSGSGPITDFGISADGRHVAFTTARTLFPLRSPFFASVPLVSAVSIELYAADLDTDTVERTSEGYDGGPSTGFPVGPVIPGQTPSTGQGASAPSFAGDDDTIVFASTADNLVFGDANRTESNSGNDVFLISRVSPPASTPVNQISSPPPLRTVDPERRLSVTVRALKDGTVRLAASVPSAGRIASTARGTVVVSRRVTVAVRARSKPKARTQRRGPVRHRVVVRRSLVERAVASATSPPIGSAGVVVVPLRLRKAYAALANQRLGFTTTITVTFRDRGGRALTQTIDATFHHVAPNKRKATKRKPAKSRAHTKPTTPRSR